MDDNAVQALTIAFSVFVFVIALSVGMFMLSEARSTSEALLFYADRTAYYDNVEINSTSEDLVDDEDIKSGTARIVNTDTIIPTLYRYYKENFCVKIYDADNNLIQVFDVYADGIVHNSAGDTEARKQNSPAQRSNYAYQQMYNDSTKPYYLFEAPWLGSTENVNTRIDYFVRGVAGYINNIYVDYTTNNIFSKAVQQGIQFKENFINYSYTGQTIQTEDGDSLVTGASSKDKIVIIYKMLNNPS